MNQNGPRPTPPPLPGDRRSANCPACKSPIRVKGILEKPAKCPRCGEMIISSSLDPECLIRYQSNENTVPFEIKQEVVATKKRFKIPGAVKVFSGGVATGALFVCLVWFWFSGGQRTAIHEGHPPVKENNRGIDIVDGLTRMVVGRPSVVVESSKYATGQGVTELHSFVMNRTNTPVIGVTFSVKVLEGSRTVPVIEDIFRVSIPGGIEANEAREIKGIVQLLDVHPARFWPPQNNLRVEIGAMEYVAYGSDRETEVASPVFVESVLTDFYDNPPNGVGKQRRALSSDSSSNPLEAWFRSMP